MQIKRRSKKDGGPNLYRERRQEFSLQPEKCKSCEWRSGNGVQFCIWQICIKGDDNETKNDAATIVSCGFRCTGDDPAESSVSD